METQAPPLLDQRASALPLAANDIVREEIPGAFRDKLGVNMTHGGNLIENPMTTDLTMTHTHKGQGYPKLQKKLGDQGKSTHEFTKKLGWLGEISYMFIFVIPNRYCLRMVHHLAI
jgi:hypothetical protein